MVGNTYTLTHLRNEKTRKEKRERGEIMKVEKGKGEEIGRKARSEGACPRKRK